MGVEPAVSLLLVALHNRRAALLTLTVADRSNVISNSVFALLLLVALHNWGTALLTLTVAERLDVTKFWVFAFKIQFVIDFMYSPTTLWYEIQHT